MRCAYCALHGLDIRGDARFYLGQFDLALEDFEKTLELDPINSEYREDVIRAKVQLTKRRAK